MGTTAYQKYSKDFSFNDFKVLNLGCGFTKFTGKNVVNLDKYECCRPDVVWDLEVTPLPFVDESFHYIFANHVFEHVHNWWKCFEECSRILKLGGTIDVFVPGSGTDSQLGFRDHVHTINHCSFYGTKGLDYAKCNAWTYANKSNHAEHLKLMSITHRMENHRWMRFFPKSLKDWCSTHLRNINNEEHYKFIKV